MLTEWSDERKINKNNEIETARGWGERRMERLWKKNKYNVEHEWKERLKQAAIRNVNLQAAKISFIHVASWMVNENIAIFKVHRAMVLNRTVQNGRNLSIE